MESKASSDRAASRTSHALSTAEEHHHLVIDSLSRALHSRCDLSTRPRYDPVDARVVRQFERLGVALEDPERYAARYADSLLETEQLLAQAKELGITEDIVCHDLFVESFHSSPLFN